MLLLSPAALAQELSSPSYTVTSQTVNGGAAPVDATNASIDSPGYRGMAFTGQGVSAGDQQLTSPSYRESPGHLFSIWGLGTRYSAWIGATAGGSTETTAQWSNPFSWGYGVPTGSRDAQVPRAYAYPGLDVPADTRDLRIESGATLTSVDLPGNFTLTCQGDVTIAGTLVWDEPGGTGISVGGHWDDTAGVFNPSVGAVHFINSATHNVSQKPWPGGNNFYDLVVDNGGVAVVALSNLVVSNHLTLAMGASSSFDTGAFSHTIGIRLIINGGTFKFGDATTNGTVNVNGAADVGDPAALSISLGTLQMDSVGDTLAVAGGVEITGGTEAVTAGRIDVGKGWDDTAASGSWTPTGGLVRFNGNVPGTWPIRQRTAATRNEFFGLEISGAASDVIYQTQEVFTLADYTGADPFRVAGSLIVSGGTWDVEAAPGDDPAFFVGSSTMVTGGTIDYLGDIALSTFAGAVTIGSGGSFLMDGGSVNVAGNWNDTGASSGFVPAAGTVTINPAAAAAISQRAGAGANSFYDLKINAGGGSTISMTTNVTVSNNLTCSAGILETGAFAHTVGGRLVLSGGTLRFGLAADGAVTVNGTGDALAGVASFEKITGNFIMNSAGDLLTVAGGVYISGGNETVTNGEIRVAKGWDDTGGSNAWSPTGGTVRFNGATAGTYAIRQRTSATRNNFVNLVIAGGANDVIYQLQENATADYKAPNPFWVAGTFSLTGGVFDILPAPSDADCRFVGAASIAGGTLDNSGSSSTSFLFDAGLTLGVGGSFLVDGGTVTVTGVWDDSAAASGFQPTGGTIQFAGVATVLQRSTLPRNFFNHLTIGGTRSIGTPTADADGSLDINGNVVINSSASFAPGAYTHTVGGSWDDSIATGGFVPAAGTIRFDSTTAGTLAIRQRTAATRNKFFNVEFAGGAGTVYQLTRVVTNAQYNPGTPFLADGSLTVSGGALDLNTPAVNNYVTVAGSVIVSPGATLDAGGMTATLRVGGDWTTNGTYTPGSVTVGFNGGVQTISTATGSDVFSSIDIGIDGAGPSVTIQGSLTVSTAVAGGFVTAGTLDVDVGATLNLAGATTYNVSPGALLQLHGDSTLALISGATLDMNFPGGTLKTSGTSPVSRATLTRSGAAGTWSLVVNGDIDIQHYRVMYLAATGLQIGAGCNVITLDSGEYDFPAVGGTLLNFDSYGSGPALSIGGCRFENSLGVSGVSNVRGIPLNPALGVTMYGWGGALGGAEYEDDSANLIGWTSDVFVRITGAGEAAFGTLQAALNAATGAGDVVESRGSSYVDLGTGAAIFPDVSGVILRNTFILNGSIQGSGGVPGNRGILRNCFVQFNGGTQNIGGTNPLDFVQNCTVVDTTGTAGTKITADSVENTILTGGAGMTISATVEFTNSIGAASSNVVDAFRGDYHHESTSIGIDVGTDLNAVHGVHAAHGFSDDIDGNPRPMGAGWDLGADEFGPGTPNAAPAWTTAEVAGGLFGKLLAPADFNFNTARLYAGTASGGASNNNSLLRINPTTGAVDYTLDLVAALDLADDGLPNASTTSAEVVTTPVMFRTADGSDGDALPDDVILVSVDTDPTPDGSGDRLAAVQDTGAALVLYVDFSGNGVLDSLDLAADRIFEPVGQPIWDSNAGVITLYIPCSTTAVSGSTALSKYNVAGLRAWAYPTRFPDRRVPVFYNRGISRCFFGITGDTIDGSDAVSVDTAGVASWAQIMGGAVVNRRPLIWISPGSSASWAMGAPEGQNAFAIEGSTGNPKWTSPDLNGTPTSQTINPFGYAWGYVGIGEHIAKFNRQTGALAADADEIGEDWATDDWLRGRISGNLLSFGGWMYCGTERGYCYRLTALNSETGSNDGRNGVVAGFPYRVPGTRIMGVSFSFAPKRAYYTCEDGRIVAFTIP